ncbi:MAG: hypothetical protein RLZZ385_1676 [Pseudomonadota bacterium]|jgi:isopenicillin N synthase-like dioxygenase
MSRDSIIKHLSMLDLQRDRAAFGNDVYAGLKDCGFVVLRDHGIPAELLQQAYELMQRFFALPLATKLKYDSGSGGARGYTAFGRENAAGNPVADLKEFWHIGQELDDASPYHGVYPVNVWPDEVPGFRECFWTLYTQLELTGKQVLGALGDAMGLAPDFFSNMVKDGNSVYRLLHYPAVEGMDTHRAMRAAPHADINLLTLLVGATDSGLELLDRNGNWIPVESEPDDIVLDTGDMMSRLTNDVLPSTLHRVVNPRRADVSRYSMPFFLHPHSNASLDCLPQCVRETPARYSPITAGDFLQQRLIEIGLLKPGN